MAEKKQQSFTVTDRRLFTPDGEVRGEITPEEIQTSTPVTTAAAVETAPAKPDPAVEMPPTPTSAEQKVQADAYQKSAKELDARVELSGHSAKELEMSFVKFMSSLYMTAMFQLGMMHEQGGQPRVDLIGARQTIDSLTLLAEKTKGNLTGEEQNFLQNCLYELRMAYVEVTNVLARPPQAAPGAGTIKP